MNGINETKEAVVGLLKLSALLGASFKDGVQVADFAVILAKLQEPELKAALEKAYQDVEKVPAEMKDISAAEAVELVIAVLPEIKNIIEALKKA